MSALRIEKFVHSCLTVSDGKTRLLFDPGRFSFIDGRVDPAILRGADFILFTHDHPDHLDVAALRSIVDHRPVQILAPDQVAERLRQAGFEAQTFTPGVKQLGALQVRAISVRHEPILAQEYPATCAFVVNDRFLNPGDSFDERLHRFAGIEALALPVMAPFLTELSAYEFAKAIRPRHVIPVHDGYARDYFLSQRYDVYEPYFEQAGMTFHRLEEPGAGIDL